MNRQGVLSCMRCITATLTTTGTRVISLSRLFSSFEQSSGALSTEFLCQRECIARNAMPFCPPHVAIRSGCNDSSHSMSKIGGAVDPPRLTTYENLELGPSQC